jgi:hypothetical protein
MMKNRLSWIWCENRRDINSILSQLTLKALSKVGLTIHKQSLSHKTQESQKHLTNEVKNGLISLILKDHIRPLNIRLLNGFIGRV